MLRFDRTTAKVSGVPPTKRTEWRRVKINSPTESLDKATDDQRVGQAYTIINIGTEKVIVLEMESGEPCSSVQLWGLRRRNEAAGVPQPAAMTAMRGEFS